MGSHYMNIINLGNSIIGVSILAMPYCFHRCGILLSLLLIILSGILVRCACYLLLKGAVMARRRNFAFLAFHAFGSSGKLAVEIGIIGFLIGVCIAFFVVIGDLGPPLVSQYLLIENTPNLRVMVLVLLGLFVALPLGMLRKVDSLTSFSALSIAFYGWLVLKIFSEASTQLYSNEWFHKVNWWEPAGVLPCLPIFSMALSCQTQLFEFFDTQSEPSMKRMMSVVSGAVCLCASVYIMVGLFGYITCYDKIITGNILVNLTPSIMTECIKIGFIVTLAISFPLCLFPCRTSLHSLLFKQAFGHHDIAVNFIPDHRFRLLTISLVIITIGVAIMIPNIEFVLGIIGSTIGTAICLIFPAVIFIHDTNKDTAEKRMAQVVMCIGIFILVACTYTTLQEGTQTQRAVGNLPAPRPPPLVVDLPPASKVVSEVPFLRDKPEAPDGEKKVVSEIKSIQSELEAKKGLEEKRQEPPVPLENDVKAEKANPAIAAADLDPQALQKEDKEIQKDILNSFTSPSGLDISLKEKQEQLIRKLEEQNKEQKILIEEQKKVLQEMKLHQERHGEMDREMMALKTPSFAAGNKIEDKLDSAVNSKKFSQKMNLVNKVSIDVSTRKPAVQNGNLGNGLVEKEAAAVLPRERPLPILPFSRDRSNATLDGQRKMVVQPNLPSDAGKSQVLPMKQDEAAIPLERAKNTLLNGRNALNDQVQNFPNGTGDQKEIIASVGKTAGPIVNLPPDNAPYDTPMKNAYMKEKYVSPLPNAVMNSVPGLQVKINNDAVQGHLLPMKQSLTNESSKANQDTLEEGKKHEMR